MTTTTSAIIAPTADLSDAVWKAVMADVLRWTSTIPGDKLDAEEYERALSPMLKAAEAGAVTEEQMRTLRLAIRNFGRRPTPADLGRLVSSAMGVAPPAAENPQAYRRVAAPKTSPAAIHGTKGKYGGNPDVWLPYFPVSGNREFDELMLLALNNLASDDARITACQQIEQGHAQGKAAARSAGLGEIQRIPTEQRLAFGLRAARALWGPHTGRAARRAGQPRRKRRLLLSRKALDMYRLDRRTKASRSLLDAAYNTPDAIHTAKSSGFVRLGQVAALAVQP